MSASSTSDDDNDENRLNLTESQLLAAQKSLISKHPLFPVLVYVLERCEQATLNPPLLTSTGEENSANSFEQNLKVFLAKNPTLLTTLKDDEQDETSALIDSFYIDAMQVLRIHLLELDKVNDLCRDFCQRYIACLKVKLNANNIFTDDEDEEEDEDDDDDEIDAEFDDAESNLDDEFESSDDDEQLMFNAKASSRKPTMFNENANHFTGQTPLSQIIGTSSTVMADSSSSSMLFESFCTKRRKTSANLSASKRGVLPKSATSIMRSWLFQHIVHPYPTEDEKRAISQKTNLSLLQVNNWFINARRRILQPMLEASNPDLAANKKKKRPSDSTADEHGAAAATQNRQMSNINRYWPANLVQFDLTTTTTTSEQRKK